MENQFAYQTLTMRAYECGKDCLLDFPAKNVNIKNVSYKKLCMHIK